MQAIRPHIAVNVRWLRIAILLCAVLALALVGAGGAYAAEGSTEVSVEQSQGEQATGETGPMLSDSVAPDSGRTQPEGESGNTANNADASDANAVVAVNVESAQAEGPMSEPLAASDPMNPGEQLAEQPTEEPPVETPTDEESTPNILADTPGATATDPDPVPVTETQQTQATPEPEPASAPVAAPKRANAPTPTPAPTSTPKTNVFTLKEGMYVLAANGKRTLALGVKGDSKKSGAGVYVCKLNGKTSQFWWIFAASVEEGTYIIESVHGGKVLVASGSAKKGTAGVKLGAYSGETSQLWIPVSLSGKRVGFKNAKTGLLLCVKGGKAKNGATVVQRTGKSKGMMKLTLVKKKPKAKNTDLGRALKWLRSYGVVVGSVKWARNVKYPKTTVSATTAQGVAITGAQIAPRLVQKIKLSRRFLSRFGSNPQAAFDKVTAAIAANGSTSGSTLYRIVLPKGTYKVRNTMHVYSNTWVDMRKGTKFKRAHSNGCMLRNSTPSKKAGGYKLSRNIIIQGGTFDANVRGGYRSDSSTIRLGHCHDVLIQGVKFYQVRTHMVELSGVRDVTVSKCSFVDNGTMKQWNEAIQVESVATKKGSSGFAPYDFTQCRNLVVEGCTFRGVNRGIGGHCAFLGRYDERILVQGNTFTNLVNDAVDIPSSRHFIIRGNTITKCGAGIVALATHHDFYKVPKGISAKVIPEAYGEISGNKITTVRRGLQVEHAGIRLMGLARNGKVYYLSSIVVSDNDVKAYHGMNVLALYLLDSLLDGAELCAGGDYVRH